MNTTVAWPNNRLLLSTGAGDSHLLECADLVSPIGRGQRGLILSPSVPERFGFVIDLAGRIGHLNRDVETHGVLIGIDQSELGGLPEKNCQWHPLSRSCSADKIDKTVEALLARAKAGLGSGKHFVIILDSFTRALVPERQAAAAPEDARLMRYKEFFTAAQVPATGGSITVLAVALFNTGSAADAVVLRAFDGTGNLQLELEHSAIGLRIVPKKSGTKHAEFLQGAGERERAAKLRST